MFLDAGNRRESQSMISLVDVAQSERIFNALAEGGNVTMPLQQTFWAIRSGMITDRFGILWMINCE
jgi:PhnB protein